MAAKIEVEQIGEGEFRVRVIEGKTETSHRVTLKDRDYERLAKGKVEPAEFVRQSSNFCWKTSRRNRFSPDSICQ